MSNYFTILTDVGASAMALAAANNTPLNLSEIALGDGNGSVPVPGPSSTLVNEVYRASINSITQHQVNPGWYVIELILPPDVGGFWIREMAVYDDNGDAIYLGNHAPEYKPLLAEGSTRDTIIRVIVETSNAAEITLIVDPNVVTATHDYVLAQFSSHVAETDPHPQYALKVGVQEQRYTAFTTTGTAPDFVGSVTPALTAYVAGQRFRVKFHNHINSSATLNINGLGALSLKQYEADGSKVGAVVGINQLVDVEYDGTDFVVLNSTSVGRGVLSKDVSGNSDVTLTRVESANEVIILTGALTGNISVILQRSHIRTWVIRNLTTGAFTVNVKTQSGTGVICDQNNNTHVFTDGVNVYNSMSGMRGIKYPVRLATIANIADLASGAPDTLDGISLVKNDRILVKSQTTKSQNGIYIVSTVGTGSDGTWVRAGDSDESPEIVPGMLVVVQEGSINQDTIWELATDSPITLGSTDLDFIVKDGNRIATIVGDSKNLVIKETSEQFTVTADEIVLKNAIGSSFLATGVSETLNPATSGVNGLDTGSLTTTNWYFIWAISDGVVNTKLLLSLSNTNPTLPSGYTYKALIGCSYRYASNFQSFVQRGNYIRCYGTGWEIFQISTANTLNANLPVPPVITKECVISVGFEGSVGEAALTVTGDDGSLIAQITSINGDNQSITRKDSIEFIYVPVTLGSLLGYSLSHNTAGTTFTGRIAGFRI